MTQCYFSHVYLCVVTHASQNTEQHNGLVEEVFNTSVFTALFG